MESKFKWSYAVIGIIVLLVLWVVVGYNGLISAKANVEGQWSNVQTTEQRRMDLIPNLVSTVKGAANFEQSTLQAVTEARTKWMSAGSRSEQIVAGQEFETALSRLLVTVEAYPQLQAVQAFRDLMTQLEGTENRIAVARRDYNAAVQDYNVRIRRFPGVLIARIFGFGEEKFFEADTGAEKAPSVSF